MKVKGRPRKGTLYLTSTGWRTRLVVDVDGEPIRKSFDLDTKDKSVAEARLQELVTKHQSKAKEPTQWPPSTEKRLSILETQFRDLSSQLFALTEAVDSLVNAQQP